MKLIIEDTFYETLEIYDTETIMEMSDFDVGLRQMLEASESTTTTATGTITLTDDSKVIQFIDPGGANRDVVLPAESTDNHGFLIFNTADAAENLVVKNDGGTEEGTVYQGGAGWFVSNGSAWESVGLGTFNPTDYAPAHIVEGRISCHATEAVPTADVVDATKIYLHRYKGKWIALYDTTLGDWERQAIPATAPELTITSLTASKNRDVFVYMNSGVMTLETVEWTNDTTRVALAYQDGVRVMSGSPNKLYLSSIRIDAGQKCQDTKLKRFCINYYNKHPRILSVVEASDAWTYNSTTLRQSNANTSNKFEFIVGVSEIPIEAIFIVSILAAANEGGESAIGLDSITAAATDATSGYAHGTSGTVKTELISKYLGLPGVGYHYLATLEKVNPATTVDFKYYVTFSMTGVIYG